MCSVTGWARRAWRKTVFRQVRWCFLTLILTFFFNVMEHHRKHLSLLFLSAVTVDLNNPTGCRSKVQKAQ